jgi:Putative Ig domain
VLPSGVSFHDNGDGSASLSGTAANGAAGSYLIKITANNGVTPDTTQSFTLTVLRKGQEFLGVPFNPTRAITRLGSRDYRNMLAVKFDDSSDPTHELLAWTQEVARAWTQEVASGDRVSQTITLSFENVAHRLVQITFTGALPVHVDRITSKAGVIDAVAFIYQQAQVD